MSDVTVGVVGFGFVGHAVAQLGKVYDRRIYDPYVPEFKHEQNKLEAYTSDFVFLCVPTPDSGQGLDVGIVTECASKWKLINSESGGNPDSILVVKSTIPVGTIDTLTAFLETENVVHNPEFLTQRTAMQDFIDPKEIIVGGKEHVVEKVVFMLDKFYRTRGNYVPRYFLTAKEAELIKMTRNSFYAMKVSFFNEIKELCDSMDIEYGSFRNVFTLDGEHPWVSDMHTYVPGPDGKVGFGGACLPKDSHGLVKLAERNGVDMLTLKGAIESNKKRRDDD